MSVYTNTYRAAKARQAQNWRDAQPHQRRERQSFRVRIAATVVAAIIAVTIAGNIWATSAPFQPDQTTTGNAGVSVSAPAPAADDPSKYGYEPEVVTFEAADGSAMEVVNVGGVNCSGGTGPSSC